MTEDRRERSRQDEPRWDWRAAERRKLLFVALAVSAGALLVAVTIMRYIGR